MRTIGASRLDSVTAPEMQQAVRLFKAGQLDAAADICAKLLAQQPDHAKTLLLMAAIYQRQSKRTESAQCLLKAAGAFGPDTEGVLQVVIALQRIGAADQAAQVLDGLDSGQAAVASLKAQNVWRLGEYTRALSLFRAARQQWPEVPANHLACARAELRLGHTDTALQTLEEGLARFPEDDQLLRMKIACLLDLGDTNGAVRLARGLASNQSEILLLKSALCSALDSETFEPSLTIGDARRQAKISSHQWVLDNSSGPAWFGTGTAVLRWAARNAPLGGVAVECGVYHGLSINLLAQWCDSAVHGFDSFEGLPEDWKSDEPAGSYSTGGKLPQTGESVTLHPGWFDDTLPEFAASLESPISLLHIDCDLYSSTRSVLEILGPRVVPGSILVFDDFLAYPGYEQHEFRAAQEYFETSGQSFKLKAAVLLGRSAAFQVE